jgi:hypothetical protein
VKHPRKRILTLLGLALPIALASLGCKKEEGISTYTAPKDIAAPTPVADATPDAPDRAKPALTPGELGFPADLRWTLPAGWKQVPVPPNPVFMPVADIQVSADQPGVLLTISQMPDVEGARSPYANINRWAGILKMPAPAEGDIGKYIAHVPVGGVPADVITLGGSPDSDHKLLGAILTHGQDVWVFKLSGPQSVIDGQNGAFADFLHSVHFDNAPPPEIAGPPAPTPAAHAPEASEPSAAAGLGGAKWTLPAGWSAEAGAAGGLRLATIRPGNGSAEIKVSKLGIVGGGLGMNVTRWHREVGLEPVDDEHADQGQPLKVGDQPWTIHDYTGPLNGGTREIIAMAEAGGNTWYFKLAGPTDEVAKLKPEFDQFVSTIRLP